jgi:hypothetical protein
MDSVSTTIFSTVSTIVTISTDSSIVSTDVTVLDRLDWGLVHWRMLGLLGGGRRVGQRGGLHGHSDRSWAALRWGASAHPSVCYCFSGVFVLVKSMCYCQTKNFNGDVVSVVYSLPGVPSNPFLLVFALALAAAERSRSRLLFASEDTVCLQRALNVHQLFL